MNRSTIPDAPHAAHQRLTAALLVPQSVAHQFVLGDDGHACLLSVAEGNPGDDVGKLADRLMWSVQGMLQTLEQRDPPAGGHAAIVGEDNVRAIAYGARMLVLLAQSLLQSTAQAAPVPAESLH